MKVLVDTSVWSLALLGIRLTLAQAAGIMLSMAGVLVILMHGDLTKLSNIEFNRGDLFVIRYRAVQPLLAEGAVELV